MLSGIQLVRLGGDDEVVPVKAPDLVRPDLQHHSAPAQVDVRMMLFPLRQLPDLHSEVESATKIRKLELSAQALHSVHLRHAPVRNMGLKLANLRVSQRRHSASACLASGLRKLR